MNKNMHKVPWFCNKKELMGHGDNIKLVEKSEGEDEISMKAHVAVMETGYRQRNMLMRKK